MFNAYTDALNSSLSLNEALAVQQENLLNFNTYGYKTKRPTILPSSFGVILGEEQTNPEAAFTLFVKGEKITKMAIDRDYPDAFFMVRDGEKEYLTRLGDFKFSRQQRAANTYIGQPFEERTYLTTQDGYQVMGYAIGKGPVVQAKRFKDPLSDPNPVLLGESLTETGEKTIGANQPLQKGPLIPIDVTRGSNGLILDRYEDVRVNKKGIMEGLAEGLWVPLYQVGLFSVPNPEGLARIGSTAYRAETEESGLRQDPPSGVRVRGEHVEKSNVNLKYDSYHYKNVKNSLNLALSLQRSNNQLFQQFQGLLSTQ
jgi:flagellar basal body rod protein FlgG